MYRIPFRPNYVQTANAISDNHKPTQTSESRTTTLTSTSSNDYNLKVEDKSSSGNKDIFTFTGNRVAAKKSYVLLFDPTSQQATLEPLSDAYTFNIATRNNKNVSSEYSKIYPKKSKDSQQESPRLSSWLEIRLLPYKQKMAEVGHYFVWCQVDHR